MKKFPKMKTTFNNNYSGLVSKTNLTANKKKQYFQKIPFNPIYFSVVFVDRISSYTKIAEKDKLEE